jgi:hypothetical protein
VVQEGFGLAVTSRPWTQILLIADGKPVNHRVKGLYICNPRFLKSVSFLVTKM